MVNFCQANPLAAPWEPNDEGFFFFFFASALHGWKNGFIFLPFISFMDEFVSLPPPDSPFLLMESIHHYPGRAEERTR